MVFICVMCLAPSYRDFTLYDHLEGDLRYASKATLLRQIRGHIDGENSFVIHLTKRSYF